MITLYWACTLCGEVGKVVVQFSGCTPLDPTDDDIQRARALAPEKINHEHRGSLYINTPKGQSTPSWH